MYHSADLRMGGCTTQHVHNDRPTEKTKHKENITQLKLWATSNLFPITKVVSNNRSKLL